MKNSLWTTITLRHTALAAFAAASIVIGSASAQAQEESAKAKALLRDYQQLGHRQASEGCCFK